METLALSDALINVFIASLQLDISAEQEKICRLCTQKLEDEIQAYPNIENALLFSFRCDIVNIVTKRNEQLNDYAEQQHNVYSTNTNIFLKYRQYFVTAEAWETERANIRRKLISEQTFCDELETKISNKQDASNLLRQKIEESKIRIQQLNDKFYDVEPLVTQFLPRM